ncbi:MAG: TolC family protein [Mariprofundales bacterium]
MHFYIFIFFLFIPTLVLAKPLAELEAVELAIANNPALASSKAKAKALAEIPAQVGSLPDPTLSLNLVNIPVSPLSISNEAMTQTHIAVMQSLPFMGKRDLRAQVADFTALSANDDSAEMRLQLIKKTRLYWWNIVYLDKALSIARRNQALLRQFVRIANSKYKTGLGLQSDVLLAQVELSQLLATEISLQGKRNSQVIQLNTLLGRVATQIVDLPKKINESLADIIYTANTDHLYQQAISNRPNLAAQGHIVAANNHRIDLANKDYYPDFKVGINYGLRSGRSDLTGIMFSMSLPIFTTDKQDHAVAQYKAELTRSAFKLDDIKLQIQAEIANAVSDYYAASQRALLFKTGIIPQSTQTVAAMLSAYQVGKVDFLNLVRAQITNYNYETQYWQTLTTAKQAWVRLEAAMGIAPNSGVQIRSFINE